MLKIETGQTNPILRKKSQPIGKIDEEILKLAQDMIETMEQNNGIGLSACQVGKNIKLFIIPREMSKHWVFINPEIIKISKKTETMKEGCLSLPGLFIPVERAESIKVKALDENSKEFKLKAKDFLARVIQHEIDHLNGILIVDKYE